MSAKHEALILLQDIKIAINEFHQRLDDEELTNLDDTRRRPQCAWRLVLDAPRGEEPSQLGRMDAAIETEPTQEVRIEQTHVECDEPVCMPELQ
jgi:hypothetical protein